MIIRRTTTEAVYQAAGKAGVDVSLSVLNPSRGGGHTISVKVSPLPGSDRWQRISPSGRRLHAVCWHGFRDFFRALFAETPNAVAKTVLATYDGAEEFEATFPATGDQNIGSAFQPMCIADACTCRDSGLRL